MTHVYTPGLKVTRRTRWRVHRRLPLPGTIHVQVGDRVSPQQIVASAAVPGDVFPLNVARSLGTSPADVPRCMAVRVGELVEQGSELARHRGLFGWFPKSLKAPETGTVESVSALTGQVMLRGQPRQVSVLAYLPGEVVAIEPGTGVEIAAEVGVVQGIFGVGGEAYGRLVVLATDPMETLQPDQLNEDHRGAVVVGGGRLTIAVIRKAQSLGVAAIVAGGLDDEDLKELLGYDLGVAVTGTESLGLSLLVTEGFGDVPMATRTFELLQAAAGRLVSVNGTTQIRAGVVRPEIVIPLDLGDLLDSPGAAANVGGPRAASAQSIEGLLEVGRAVRLIRDPDFGTLGQVVALPTDPQLLDSGAMARVLVIETRERRRLTVPRANVELIEE